MNLAGKKKKITDAKKYSPTQEKKTSKRTIYTSLPMCLCTKFYTKGTVYSSVKAKAITIGQEVENNIRPN